MFEAINEWISTYIETPYYQITVECECLFYLAIAIYSAMVIATIFLVWIIAKWFKKFVDNAAEREARYKEEKGFEKQEPTQEAETEDETWKA